MDTTVHPELLNTRFAYVSVSRAAHDARIYTNDATALADRLSNDVSKNTALEIRKPEASQVVSQKEPWMNKNTEQQFPNEGRRESQSEAPLITAEKARTPVLSTSPDDHRYAPLQKAVPGETYGYEWKRDTGDIQSYRHNVTTGWLHIDLQGQFRNRQGQAVLREAALESTGHSVAYTRDPSLPQNQQTIANSQGMGH